MMPPRLALIACGTLALTIYCWTVTLPSGAGQSLGIILHTAWLGGSIAMLLLAALAKDLQFPAEVPAYRATSATLIVLLALAVGGSLTIGVVTVRTITRANPDYSSDAAAFNHFNAQLVLEDVNPYTAGNRFWHAIAEFPYAGATPLDLGRYAGSRYQPYGPSLTQIVSDVQQELANPALRGPEYDPATLHSYPALAFLVYVPNVLAGWPSTAPTGVVFLLLFGLATVWGAPRMLWPYLILALLANQFLVLGALRGEFEAVAYLMAICAWRLRDRGPVTSPVLLGLSAAVKQIVWPLLPLYVIIEWRRLGMRAALTRLAIAVAAFLAPNLPFILSSPSSWASSMLLPVTLPLFPSGIGLVELTHGGLMPLWPAAVYTAAELAALLAVYLWFARSRIPLRPELAPLLALLPYLLAWRSLLAYFLVLPLLAIYASLPLLGGRVAIDGDAPVTEVSPGRAVASPGAASGVRTGTTGAGAI